VRKCGYNAKLEGKEKCRDRASESSSGMNNRFAEATELAADCRLMTFASTVAFFDLRRLLSSSEEATPCRQSERCSVLNVVRKCGYNAKLEGKEKCRDTAGS
jgi:hypothetical protein